MTVRVLDANGDEVENATFTFIGWSSPCCRPDIDLTDPRVFGTKRTDDGLEITSRGPGSGQITISSTGVESAILPVTVYMKPATLEISPRSASLAVDGTATLRATIKDANGNSIHVHQGDGPGRQGGVLGNERRRGGDGRGEYRRRRRKYRRYRHGDGGGSRNRDDYRPLGR